MIRPSLLVSLIALIAVIAVIAVIVLLAFFAPPSSVAQTSPADPRPAFEAVLPCLDQRAAWGESYALTEVNASGA